MRYALLVLTTLLLTSTAIAQETVTVNLTVTSNLDQNPVSDATARLLLDGEIKAEAQTGADGTAELTWSSVNIPNGHEIPSDFEITALYPNPVASQATVQVANRHERAVTVGIYDVLGRQIASRSINLTEGISRVPLQAGLAYGVYFVRFSGAGIDHTRSFLSTGQQGTVMVGAPQWIGRLEQTSTKTQSPIPFDTGIWEVTVEKNGFEPYAALIEPDSGIELEIEIVLTKQTSTITFQSNETRSFPPEVKAYLVTLNAQGEPVDSLISYTGVFENVPLRGEGRFRGGFLTLDDAFFSYVRTDTAQPGEHLTRIVDWYVRDINKNIVGELVPGAHLADSPEGWYNWIATMMIDNGPAVNRWNGTGPLLNPDKFFYYALSDNGRGPDEIKVALSIFSPVTGDTFVMTDYILDVILEEYENNVAGWIHEDFRPPMNVYEHLEFDHQNNQHANEPIIYARPGTGAVTTYGTLVDGKNVVKHALIGQVGVEEGELSDALVRRIANHEMTPGILFNHTMPSDCCTTIYQSVTHNAGQQGAQVATNLDGKVSRLLYEPTFTNTTSVSDVIKLPAGYVPPDGED